MRIRKIVSLLVLTTMHSLLFAQDKNVSLTLDNAIRMSLQQSKLLQLDSGKMNEARAKYQQAYNQQLPVASISGSYVRVSDNVTPFTIQGPSGGKMELNPQVLNQYYTTLLSLTPTKQLKRYNVSWMGISFFKR